MSVQTKPDRPDWVRLIHVTETGEETLETNLPLTTTTPAIHTASSQHHARIGTKQG